MPAQKFNIDDPLINENFRELFNNAQDISHKIFRTVPNVKEMREGEIVLYDDGTNRRIYCKINGTLRYVALT